MRVGDSTTFGQYEWRVLDIKSGEALLITEDMIGQRSFHNRSGGTTWAECELRAYLNGEFYASFSEADRARIVPVTNRNPDNPWYGSSGGEDTRDHVFLLSIEEAVCQYFGDSSKNLENRSAKQRYWFKRRTRII